MGLHPFYTRLQGRRGSVRAVRYVFFLGNSMCPYAVLFYRHVRTCFILGDMSPKLPGSTYFSGTLTEAASRTRNMTLRRDRLAGLVTLAGDGLVNGNDRENELCT